jgi:hypothetical protein
MATTTANTAPTIATIAAAATTTTTNCHSRRRARLPAPRPAASKPSLPSSARAPSIRAHASSVSPCSPPAASVATQSPPAAPAPAGLGHTCHIPHCLTLLLLLHGRLWLCRWVWVLEAGVAGGKSQNRECPFAAVSGFAACPVVKRALRVVCVAAWSMHHVRALASSFVSGGDDYLFLLFDGSCMVRATTSPATALAAAAAYRRRNHRAAALSMRMLC